MFGVSVARSDVCTRLCAQRVFASPLSVVVGVVCDTRVAVRSARGHGSATRSRGNGSTTGNSVPKRRHEDRPWWWPGLAGLPPGHRCRAWCAPGCRVGESRTTAAAANITTTHGSCSRVPHAPAVGLAQDKGVTAIMSAARLRSPDTLLTLLALPSLPADLINATDEVGCTQHDSPAQQLPRRACTLAPATPHIARCWREHGTE